MELTVPEKNSSTWLKVDEFLRESIESARTTLEGQLDEHQTNHLRGRIRAYRRVLSLGDDQPIIEEEPLPE